MTTTRPIFKYAHPEIQPGEIMIGNSNDDNYYNCGWKTKRKGEKAYDVDGEMLGEFEQAVLSPVFVKISELLDNGFVWNKELNDLVSPADQIAEELLDEMDKS